MSTLFVVPTPIGNLEDITLRAIRVLKEVDLIYAEDTRTTKKLLAHFQIKNELASNHIHNEHKTLAQKIDRIKSLNAVALVSDAGTPGISDPGYLLINECYKNAINVICLPGATAFVPALVGSGFPTDTFLFIGFLPHKKGRKTIWLKLACETRTIVLYESPHRIEKFLKEFQENIGNERKLCVVREISKIHEQFIRGNAKELIAHFQFTQPKGEMVVVIEPVKLKKI